ncbi:hypothetical protein BDP27DRAFT_207937 [Rhodocollybia butyracea]|uniref:Peptidase C14 caspase domain-containing protein n=1 Tax=Rhodocollybia butyracea TaxID=206335 RepID=A0A9P5P573_9AGAR|nr:hypothetical protein BDP27DRAFT_207937 [Rhodocollybia butyracea]
MQELLVPFDRITVLLSPTGAEHIPCSYEIPTRDKILNALYGLYDNPDIKPDDSIIFFYAGHGQSYPAAQSSFVCTPKSTGSIEAVCPVDRNTPKSRTTIVDISDREINVILGEIAKKRCENITVILDCCYAGGGTRSTSSSFDSLQLGEKGCFTARTCPAIPNANRANAQSCGCEWTSTVRQTPHRCPKLPCQYEITRIDCFRQRL